MDTFNSGNPVFDAWVNLTRAVLIEHPDRADDLDYMRRLHALILELARKEPDGLQRPGGMEVALPATD